MCFAFLSATHRVIFNVPDLERRAEQYKISLEQLGLLMKAHVLESIHDNVHSVAIDDSTVTVTTKDSGDASSQQAAERLRRDVATGVLEGDHLGLTPDIEMALNTPAGLETRGKRQAECLTLSRAFQNVIPGPFDLCQIVVSFC